MSRKIIQDDKELFQISQIELKKLQRQYRIMEGDKNSYGTEIKCCLLKQRKIIDALNIEQNTLLNRISQECTDNNNKEFHNHWNKQFSDLLKTYEKYLLQIKQKKDKVRKLDNTITMLRETSGIIQNDNEMKTTQMDKSIGKLSKQIYLLQNKLYNETVKYDEILAENLETRHAVDALLRSRERFNERYKKLVMKLNSERKALLSLIDQATVCCEQRDEADEKLKSAVNKEQQEITAHKHKIRELYRQLDHLIHLKKFISVKGQRRILVDLEEKENRKKLQKEDELKQHMNKHNSILEQLKKICDENNVDKLVGIFLKQEEENFALFNYVNEINSEVESLQEEVKSLQTSLESQRKLNIIVRKERSKSSEPFRLDLKAKRESVEKLKDELCQSTRNLHIIFDEIGTIVFSVLKGPSFIHLLGKKYNSLKIIISRQDGQNLQSYKQAKDIGLPILHAVYDLYS